MKLLLALLLLTSCSSPRIVVRYDYYPPVTLTCTVLKDGEMVNKPVTFQATYEVTRWAE